MGWFRVSAVIRSFISWALAAEHLMTSLRRVQQSTQFRLYFNGQRSRLGGRHLVAARK